MLYIDPKRLSMTGAMWKWE